MRIVVTGATGNVGTSVVAGARRRPRGRRDRRASPAGCPPGGRRGPAGSAADIERDDLLGALRGRRRRDPPRLADPAQPRRRASSSASTSAARRRSSRPRRAPASARSSTRPRSASTRPARRTARSTSRWPREGVPTLFYARHKAEAEREPGRARGRAPELRVVRLRPGLIFKREAGPEIRRLFAGPLLPGRAAQARPAARSCRCPTASCFQCVHAADIGEAYRLAATHRTPAARTTSPPTRCWTADTLAAGARGAAGRGVPERPLRIAADLRFRARLQPAPPGWLDMGLAVPTMDTAPRPRGARLDAAPQRAPRRCTSCWPGCATRSAPRRRRWSRTRAVRCA